MSGAKPFNQMIVVTTTAALKAEIGRVKEMGKSVGFVPTMGALHEGHLSLVTEARKHQAFSVVSIFVNPTQFNDPADLDKYPRAPEKDLALLDEGGCDLVFLPEVSEVYPEPDFRKFAFGHLDSILEGAFRPGHFNGVAQVVSRLFEMVEPDVSYFGQKDYQQLLIIREMVRQLNLKVKVVECPIIREPDGLAMSSRNMRLSLEDRAQAPFIFQVLKEAVGKLSFATVENIADQVTARFRANGAFRLEYFAVCDQENLEFLTGRPSKPFVACIAAWLGQVRLIDNLKAIPKR